MTAFDHIAEDQYERILVKLQADSRVTNFARHGTIGQFTFNGATFNWHYNPVNSLFFVVTPSGKGDQQHMGDIQAIVEVA